MSTVRLRDLNPDEQHAFTLARLHVAHAMPYLPHALFNVQPVIAEGLGTFAVDRHWRLYMDPEALTGWDVPVVAGSLGHEVAGHLLRDHATRATALGPDYSPLLWNLATDAAINDDLIEAGLQLPEGVVTPEALDLPPQGVEESYYATLASRVPPGEQTADDGCGCGSGAGDPTPTWELPATGTPGTPGQGVTAPALTAERAESIRRTVAVAVRDLAAGSPTSGRGTVPAGLRRWAEQSLQPPQVPWQEVLRGTLRRAVNFARGSGRRTFTRLPRRRVPGVVLPGTRRPVVRIAVVIDTSASMSDPQVAAALAEVEGILRSGATGPAPGLRVIACDAAVAATAQVRRTQDVELAGGGGTDMRVGIAAAEADDPNAIVVLSDGYTLWPDTPTRARLIAVLLAQPSQTVPDTVLAAVPSWATAIPVTPSH